MNSSESDVREFRPRIDISDYFELRGWAKRFGVTAGEVRQAVARVGDHPTQVEHYLRFVSASVASGLVDGLG
ncbi:MAG: DUF3606 domain-containing protein [Burkholderiaceae bacterium]